MGFFRESATLEALKKRVFPLVFQRHGPESPVRVWVPGCGAGEEAYSIAICFLESMRGANPQIPVRIFATDISAPALRKARAGVYPGSIADHVSRERLERFFVRTEYGLQVNRAVGDLCVFAQQNPVTDPPFSKLDLIYCGNMFSSLGPALRTAVLKRFHSALTPEGFLVLGESDTMVPADDLFIPLQAEGRIYARQQRSAPLRRLDPDRQNEVPAAALPVPDRQVQQVRPLAMGNIAGRAAGVVVDRHMKILQFLGRTAPYLQRTGEAQLNLASVVRRELRPGLPRLFERALTSGLPVRGDRQPLMSSGRRRSVGLSITPLRLPRTVESRYLVLFEEFPESSHKKRAQTGKPTEELLETQYYLESVIEEQEVTLEALRTASEELQSSNEELQSTNEELLSVQGELQSANQELTMLNEALSARNNELTLVNDDLINLLNGIQMPVVIVGGDLRIRRFTPQAQQFLGLLPGDVGRRIGNLTSKIDIPNLEHLLLDAIDNLKAQEREVQDADGRWHILCARPYRTSGNKIEGAVLLLFDITDRKACLARSIVHDLNNLLTTILGYADLAKSRLDPHDPLYGDMDRIVSAGARAATLTARLPAPGRAPAESREALDLNQAESGCHATPAHDP